ncbi:tetratricopeptide repeat protein [Anditalea andensis]|uniref:Uncharacterized protein n=1 Tax=Anditalea andensis TaxID=1048983 RepID=A0A074KUI0_9BACT|nr:tetratricopeptide repeat protein [Anditalea andensis]KEO72564.1 hypothetical protein EL17_17660 [Anditalea andensis]
MTQVYSIVFLLIMFIPASWQRIANKNSAIESAEKAYKSSDFENSIRGHLLLISDYDLNTAEVNFNLGLSYQLNGQEDEAQRTFGELVSSAGTNISSYAANQSGTISAREEKYDAALQSFRAALIKNPDNEAARYNYEMLARWLEKNKDQQEQDQQEQDDDQLQPSNYAKRMKAQADQMVDRFNFSEALNIMNRALEIDETVSYYQEFINNLTDVNEISSN